MVIIVLTYFAVIFLQKLIFISIISLYFFCFSLVQLFKYSHYCRCKFLLPYRQTLILKHVHDIYMSFINFYHYFTSLIFTAFAFNIFKSFLLEFTVFSCFFHISGSDPDFFSLQILIWTQGNKFDPDPDLRNHPSETLEKQAIDQSTPIVPSKKPTKPFLHLNSVRKGQNSKK